MPINVDTAAKIARKHGLTLHDAQALSVMADDEDHADRLAGSFVKAEDINPAKLAADVPRR